MSLAESINKHNNRPRGVDVVLAMLTAEQGTDLRAALDNPSIGNVAIARGLRDHGVKVDEASVRRWRERLQTVDGL